MILKDFVDYEKKRGGNSKLKPDKTGHYLFEVHSRVNALKHRASPEEDFLPPKIRIEELRQSLRGIYELFPYIAEKRGALKES